MRYPDTFPPAFRPSIDIFSRRKEYRKPGKIPGAKQGESSFSSFGIKSDKVNSKLHNYSISSLIL
jgi:hypothetical protein